MSTTTFAPLSASDANDLVRSYREQLDEIGETLVEAGYLTREAVGRHGVRFAVRERFVPNEISEGLKNCARRTYNDP